MIAYKYNTETKEYIGETTSQIDPLETEKQRKNIYLLPSNSTFKKPPVTQDNEVAVFNGVKWNKEADYRNCVFYDTQTKEKHEITIIGEKPLSNWTDKDPIDNEAVWNGTDWEIPFVIKKKRKKAQIASDRWQFETSGMPFGDSTIKTDRESVALLKGAYDESVANPDYTVNWKAEEGFVTLNAEQIKTIYQRVRAHVQSAFDAEMRLVALINEATTDAELEAIVWVDPN